MGDIMSPFLIRGNGRKTGENKTQTLEGTGIRLLCQVAIFPIKVLPVDGENGMMRDEGFTRMSES